MVDYIGPTASLLESTGKLNMDQKQLKAAQDMRSQELVTQSANAAAAETGALKRTELQSKQAQLLETLKNQASMALEGMKSNEAAKLKERELKAASDLRHQQDYFTLTPNLVKGLKTQLGLDLTDSENKEVHAPTILAMIAAKAKEDAAATAATAHGKTPEDLNKELRILQGSIKANRDKLMGLTSKDLPNEVWGGEPGNIAKAIQYISAGKFGNLDPNEQKQIQFVAGYINTMKAQQQRANELHKALGSQTEDYTGMGLTNLPSGGSVTPSPQGGGGNDDNTVIQVRTSDGTIHSILKKNLSIAQQRDPKLQVVGSNPTQIRK